jgi:hypothetical protein
MWFPLVYGTISKIEIDQRLVRNSGFLRYGLELSDRVTVQAYADRLFEIFQIGVFAPFHFGKIVVLSHRRLQYSISSSVLAFRAEMNGSAHVND